MTKNFASGFDRGSKLSAVHRMKFRMMMALGAVMCVLAAMRQMLTWCWLVNSALALRDSAMLHVC
jgi:hypothetical protein